MISEIKPTILVLLASYNGDRWIRDQLNSILSQVDVNLKILISDDFSTDQTRTIIAELMAVDSRISMLPLSVQSGSSGKNFYRLMLDCDVKNIDFIAFSDQDDLWEQRKLISAIAYLNQYNCGGYSCAVKAFWEDGRSRLITQSNKILPLDFIFEGAGQGCTFVIPSNIFLEVKDFILKNKSLVNEFFFHDWLVYILIRCWGYGWIFDTRPWLMYRQHSENVNGSRGNLSAVFSRLKLIRSGWYGKQIDLAINIAILNKYNNVFFINFINLYKKKYNIAISTQLILILIQFSRRKLLDRLVLCFALTIGWL